MSETIAVLPDRITIPAQTQIDLETAIRTRRSVQHLTEPAPSDATFIHLLQYAALGPDHGRLHPWRWILLRGRDRNALGACFAQETEVEPATGVAAKTLRAPLLASFVFSPTPRDRIPAWEQLAAAVGVSTTMQLLLHGRGFGSIWRTGASVRSPGARALLDLQPAESLLGWLYIGTPHANRTPAPRPPLDITAKVTSLPPRSVPVIATHNPVVHPSPADPPRGNTPITTVQTHTRPARCEEPNGWTTGL